MLQAYLEAWVVTLAVEVPVVAALYPGRRLRMALVCIVASSITHLAMHFLLPLVLGSYTAWIIAGELGATAVEAAAYYGFATPRSLGRALVASAAANSLSYAAGLLLYG